MVHEDSRNRKLIILMEWNGRAKRDNGKEEIVFFLKNFLKGPRVKWAFHITFLVFYTS